MNTLNIPLDSIRVSEDRFRPADPKKSEEISQSYKTFGQLQPIIVVRTGDDVYDLVDGLHRLTAKRLLNEPTIAAVLRDEVDELFIREMELEVNIKRKEMTWQEEQKALATLHQLKVARDPNWGLAQTAELAGESRGKPAVSEAVKLFKMMEMFPEIAQAKNKAQAMRWVQQKARNIVRAMAVKDNKVDYEFLQNKILLGDSVELIKAVPDGSFHAVITDPPFGIDYDGRKAGTNGALTSYEDDEGSYRRLLSMAPDIFRVLRPDGWLVWFFGMSWYEECKRAFREAGFTVDELPIIWDRSEGKAFTTQPDRYFGRSYDVALHCFKGNPGIVIRNKPNIIRVAPLQTSERETLVERPVELYEELIKRLTIPGEVVADFFVGSGSCCAAAAKNKRDFFGIELDPERRAYALTKIKAYIPEGFAEVASGSPPIAVSAGEVAE